MKSPRVHVSVDPAVYESICTIAKGTNQSASGFIASMLLQQGEVLSQIAAAVDKARKLSAPLSGALIVSLANKEALALQNVHHSQHLLDELSDDLTDEMHKQSDGRVSRAPRGEQRRSDPPAINKGVHSQGVKSR